MTRGVFTLIGVAGALILGGCTVASVTVDQEIAVGPDRQAPPSTSTTLAKTAPLQGLVLTPLAEGLDQPVAFGSAPGLNDTFVVERSGTVVTLSSGGADTVLDISDQIAIVRGNEQGLLALTPHPDFPNDPRAIAIYTDLNADVVVSSFDWVGDRFDPGSETLILGLPQPHFYHQGGGITFGPEGYLWMSFGDGGGVGDRFKNGQDPTTLQGTVVRIDIDNGEPYVLPPTNPFLDSPGAPEVWAYGLRNPWRITVDGDDVIIVDVGQEGFEEVNIVPATSGGQNFGWPILEGNDCYEATTCDIEGLTAPVYVIDSTVACALIGGPVYRGAAIPELHGQFVFGDFCRGWMNSAAVIDGTMGAVTDWTPMLDPIGNITTFGLDPTGELLVATLEGTVSRIDPVR